MPAHAQAAPTHAQGSIPHHRFLCGPSAPVSVKFLWGHGWAEDPASCLTLPQLQLPQPGCGVSVSTLRLAAASALPLCRDRQAREPSRLGVRPAAPHRPQEATGDAGRRRRDANPPPICLRGGPASRNRGDAAAPARPRSLARPRPLEGRVREAPAAAMMGVGSPYLWGSLWGGGPPVPTRSGWGGWGVLQGHHVLPTAWRAPGEPSWCPSPTAGRGRSAHPAAHSRPTEGPEGEGGVPTGRDGVGASWGVARRPHGDRGEWSQGLGQPPQLPPGVR